MKERVKKLSTSVAVLLYSLIGTAYGQPGQTDVTVVDTGGIKTLYGT